MGTLCFLKENQVAKSMQPTISDRNDGFLPNYDIAVYECIGLLLDKANSSNLRTLKSGSGHQASSNQDKAQV